MRGVKWFGRLVAGVAIASVLAVGGAVYTRPAVAAPPAAPWLSPPPVGSWVPIDTPNGSIRVKVVAPGIAVHPGQLDDGKDILWSGLKPTTTYSAERQERFVAKVEALIGFLQSTPSGSELLAGFGRIAPLPDAKTGGWGVRYSTFSSGGQPTAINQIMGIGEDLSWANVPLHDERGQNGEGTVSIMNVPEGVGPSVSQLGTQVIMVPSDAVAFHELTHAWRELNGYAVSMDPKNNLTVTAQVNGKNRAHTVPLEEALTTGGPLMLMHGLGYDLASDGRIIIKPDPRVAEAIRVATEREAAILRQHGPRTDGLVAPITTARTVGQGFTEHLYVTERGMPARMTYKTVHSTTQERYWFGLADDSLSFFVEALNGYTPADVTDPWGSRWFTQVQNTPPSCGSVRLAACDSQTAEVPPTDASTKTWEQYQAAVDAGRPVVSTPAGGGMLSPSVVGSMSVAELVTLARGQFGLTVRTVGAFGGVGESGKAFVGLPQTRELLNRADLQRRSATGDGLDGLDFVEWVRSVKGAFGKDVSNLQTAATLTAMVPLLAESMGLAVAAQSGDETGVAANAVALLSSVASLFISNPVAGLAVGLIGMLVVGFIYAFSMPDPSPVAFEHVKKYRDKAFTELIPKLAKDFTAVVAEAFAASQSQQVVALGVTDAAIDRAAESAALADPVNGQMFAEEARRTKTELHTRLQASLTAQKTNLTGAVKTAFRELISSEVADPKTQQLVTDEVLPLFQHEGQGYAWASPYRTVTAGWEYFVQVAENTGEYACLYGRDGGWKKRTAADFAAGADLQDCVDTIHVMNTSYVPTVQTLRSTPLVAPSAAVLDQAIDAGWQAPDTVANLTVLTIPAATATVKDRPWRMDPPPVGARAETETTQKPVPGLLTGQGKAGHTIQIRDQDNHTLCTAEVNAYGSWGCVTADLIAPGFTLSLWEKNTHLGVSTGIPGTALTISMPTPNSVNPLASLTLTGTGTHGHPLTFTLHHPPGDQPTATTLEANAAVDGTWSVTLPAGTLKPGRTYSASIADKTVYDHRSITFTTH